MLQLKELAGNFKSLLSHWKYQSFTKKKKGNFSIFQIQGEVENITTEST